jgi:hypothetical protein
MCVVFRGACKGQLTLQVSRCRHTQTHKNTHKQHTTHKEERQEDNNNNNNNNNNKNNNKYQQRSKQQRNKHHLTTTTTKDKIDAGRRIIN